jgi:hypothetical protein
MEAETALFTRAFPFLFSMIDEVEISPEQRNWIAEFFFALSKLYGKNWLIRIVSRAKSYELARKNPALKVCVWG